MFSEPVAAGNLVVGSDGPNEVPLVNWLPYPAWLRWEVRWAERARACNDPLGRCLCPVYEGDGEAWPNARLVPE